MLEFHEYITFILWMVKKDVENVDLTINDIFVGFFLSNNNFDANFHDSQFLT